MAQAKFRPNSFTSYDLDVEEELQGGIYTVTQVQVLQNELSIYAEEKIALEYNPEHPGDYLQKEASLKGKIDLLRYLIEKSEGCQLELVEHYKNQQNTQV